MSRDRSGPRCARSGAAWARAGFVLLLAAGAAAAGTEDLRREARLLRHDRRILEATSPVFLEREVERYLAAGARLQGGGGADRIATHARFTTVVQGLWRDSGSDPVLVGGDADLEFVFAVSDRLDLFVRLHANTDSGFPDVDRDAVTAAGLTDGIGIDGTRPTDRSRVGLYEAGYRRVFSWGEARIEVEAGALDPRRRFSQNAFADDEDTQFLDNLFDDPPSILWLTDSSGRISLGTYGRLSLGPGTGIVLSAGWFNTPATYFNEGQAYAQVEWNGMLGRRPVHVRLFAVYDKFFREANPNGSAAGGVSLDWQASDRFGVFLRVSRSWSDFNPVRADGSAGFVWTGPLPGRPDDQLGVAVGAAGLQDGTPFGAFPDEVEIHVEAYYRVQLEGGRLQVTPHLMLVTDPRGGTLPDDTLVVLGLRVHVPF